MRQIECFKLSTQCAVFTPPLRLDGHYRLFTLGRD